MNRSVFVTMYIHTYIHIELFYFHRVTLLHYIQPCLVRHDAGVAGVVNKGLRVTARGVRRGVWTAVCKAREKHFGAQCWPSKGRKVYMRGGVKGTAFPSRQGEATSNFSSAYLEVISQNYFDPRGCSDKIMVILSLHLRSLQGTCILWAEVPRKVQQRIHVLQSCFVMLIVQKNEPGYMYRRRDRFSI